MSETKANLENEVDALFRLPLAEFIGARNALAARLKKEKRFNEAERVKALVKPPVSAWTVNQLYWKHRNAFDRLMVTGERFRKAQTSRGAAKIADMREALDARRDALTQLSDLATELLQDAGHNPSPDTIRRITTTLEALSVYASLPNGPRSGRLTQDVDPPGFESLTSMMPSAGVAESSDESAWTTSSKKPVRDVATIKRTPESVSNRRQNQETRRLEDTRQTAITAASETRQTRIAAASEARQTRIAAARVSLQESKRLLSEARARVQSAEAAQKKANAELKEAEKQKLEAEELLDKARAALIDATRRARSVAPEVEKAAKAMDNAERNVEKAKKELEEVLSS